MEGGGGRNEKKMVREVRCLGEASEALAASPHGDTARCKPTTNGAIKIARKKIGD
jgi:hypothetical protein